MLRQKYTHTNRPNQETSVYFSDLCVEYTVLLRQSSTAGKYDEILECIQQFRRLVQQPFTYTELTVVHTNSLLSNVFNISDTNRLIINNESYQQGI